jgi:hypothetical protein
MKKEGRNDCWSDFFEQLGPIVSLIGQWGPHIPSLSKPSCLGRRGEMGPSFLWGISKERNLFLEELVEYRIIFTYIHQ